MIIDHPRKGKEWRVGDLQNGVRIMLIEGGEAYFFGGRHDDVESLDPDQHEPVDSPEESTAMQAEIDRLTKERDELAESVRTLLDDEEWAEKQIAQLRRQNAALAEALDAAGGLLRSIAGGPETQLHVCDLRFQVAIAKVHEAYAPDSEQSSEQSEGGEG